MKIDRLIGILSILLQQEKVTAPFLAEKFEVSRRTINRDIEDLSKAGIPIVTLQGQNGGITIMDGYKIDKTLVTSTEMQSILAGLKSLDSISGSNKYRQLMNKLSVEKSSLTYNDQIIIDLSSWDKNSLAPKFEIIKKAIENKNMIFFEYYSPKGESKRQIEPYLLTFQWSSWYVWGFCLDKKDYRMFKLNRMLNIYIDSNLFFPRKVPKFTLDKEQVFPFTIKLIATFEKDMKWRLIDEYGVDSFEEKENHLLFEFGFMDKESVFRWLLSYGTKVNLISPKELVPEFIQLTKNILEKYQT